MQSAKTSSEILQRSGVKPSYARIRIYDYLLTKRSHPTVDEIFTELVPEIPTLSRTTVYNTLALFKEKGLLQLITIEQNELRYDADTACHGHFKCGVCGKVYDFESDIDTLRIRGLEGFEIAQKNVYFAGVCAKCAENAKNDK